MQQRIAIESEERGERTWRKLTAESFIFFFDHWRMLEGGRKGGKKEKIGSRYWPAIFLFHKVIYLVIRASSSFTAFVCILSDTRTVYSDTISLILLSLPLTLDEYVAFAIIKKKREGKTGRDQEENQLDRNRQNEKEDWWKLARGENSHVLEDDSLGASANWDNAVRARGGWNRTEIKSRTKKGEFLCLSTNTRVYTQRKRVRYRWWKTLLASGSRPISRSNDGSRAREGKETMPSTRHPLRRPPARPPAAATSDSIVLKSSRRKQKSQDGRETLIELGAHNQDTRRRRVRRFISHRQPWKDQRD